MKYSLLRYKIFPSLVSNKCPLLFTLNLCSFNVNSCERFNGMFENFNTNAVMDGDIDDFINAFLKSEYNNK